MGLERYNLQEAVGRGGMGVVYRAVERESHETVAVKMMFPEAAADPILLSRFERECDAICRLRHPNLVAGQAHGRHEGRPYLIMEFVAGRTLSQHVRQLGPFAEADAIRLICQVADALELAHREQLIHRDVKPDNILLTSDGTAKLADLGLIKDLASTLILTRPGVALGTIVFTAPEQFGEADHATVRSDVYGLAATMYYLVTGCAPFTGRGNLTLLEKKFKSDFVPPSDLLPTLSPGVNAAICQALQADPAQRPESCHAFAELLFRSTVSAESSAVGQQEVPALPTVEKLEESWAERRTNLRYPSSLIASYQMMKGDRRHLRAVVQDISLSGICLQLEHSCERHALLKVELCDKPSDMSFTLLAKVNWVRTVAPGTWQVGCAFSRSLGEDELYVLLSNMAPTEFSVLTPEVTTTCS